MTVEKPRYKQLGWWIGTVLVSLCTLAIASQALPEGVAQILGYIVAALNTGVGVLPGKKAETAPGG